MPNEQSWRGVDDEVCAVACRIGEEQSLFVRGPTLPLAQIRIPIALDAPAEADVAVGLEPDEHRLKVRVPSRARARTLNEQKGRGGEAVPVGISIVLPVPSPVCRLLATCDRGQDLVVQVGNALVETVPAGVHVVHVQDVGAGDAFGEGGSEVRLARATGSVDGHDFRGAATWLGSVDGPECLRDRLVRCCEVHVWTVDSRDRAGGARYARRVSVAIRVIPCLDVDAGRVVKGVNFENLRDAGDPVELAKRYDQQGADELTFLDVTASSGNRETTFDVVRRTAEQVFIPLTVGGGVRTVDDVDRLLRAGADKVGVNTAAISRPDLIADIADRFGSQVLVLSADVRRRRDESGSATGEFEVTTHGGRQGTGLDAIAWCARAAELGAGEILLNSMDADGTKDGFDLQLIAAVRREVSVPLIASGGAGTVADFAPAVDAGADAVLAASVFHFGELTIGQVKDALRSHGLPVR